MSGWDLFQRLTDCEMPGTQDQKVSVTLPVLAAGVELLPLLLHATSARAHIAAPTASSSLPRGRALRIEDVMCRYLLDCPGRAARRPWRRGPEAKVGSVPNFWLETLTAASMAGNARFGSAHKVPVQAARMQWWPPRISAPPLRHSGVRRPERRAAAAPRRARRPQRPRQAHRRGGRRSRTWPGWLACPAGRSPGCSTAAATCALRCSTP